MIAWRGAGFVVFIVGAIAFLGVVLGFDGPEKSTLFPWGIAAAVTGVVSLPLGLILNQRRAENTHDFMFVPMQYWGGLLLIGGLGMLGAHVFMAPSEAAASSDPCAELSTAMASCGPAGGMLVSACTQSAPATQAACLQCVESSPSPCGIGGCQAACGFGP